MQFYNILQINNLSFYELSNFLQESINIEAEYNFGENCVF